MDDSSHGLCSKTRFIHGYRPRPVGPRSKGLAWAGVHVSIMVTRRTGCAGEADPARVDSVILVVWRPDPRGMDQLQTKRASGKSYQNGVLTVIAGCLGLLVLDRQGAGVDFSPKAAMAQPNQADQETTGIASGLEQRKQMIAELVRIGQKLDRLESKISGGLTVKVSNLPAAMNSEGRAGGEPGAPKATSKIEIKPDANRAQANRPASVRGEAK